MQVIDKLVIAHKHELARNEKDAVDLADAIFSRDEKAFELLNKHANLFGMALRNEELPEQVMKYASTSVSPVITSVGGLDGLLQNPLGIDMNFMPLYQMATGAPNADEIRIFDFENLLTHKEYTLGANIESEPFGNETAERLGIRRFGGGSVVLRMLAKNQARYTVNNILRAHQLAEMRMRSNWAYAQVDAAADAAITATQVTSFTINIVTSLNNAYQAVVTRLVAANYQITDDVPMILVAHASHRPAIQAALRTIIGDNGTNTLLEYPIRVVYTWNTNILTQYDGANAAILILPERKNVWGEFDSPRIEQERNPRTDGIDLVYQYHFNSQLSTLQTQVVKIA